MVATPMSSWDLYFHPFEDGFRCRRHNWPPPGGEGVCPSCARYACNHHRNAAEERDTVFEALGCDELEGALATIKNLTEGVAALRFERDQAHEALAIAIKSLEDAGLIR